MKATRYILSIMLALAVTNTVQATDYIRYVSKKLGSYNNDGTSWVTSKVNVQDAINDIKDKIGEGDRGFVFVDEGSYKPTQSVAGSSSSTLYMSIQIPAGVRVYGGFKGEETGSTPEAIIAKRETVTTEVGTYMKNQTVFTGSLSSNAQFVWNDSKHKYTTSFFGNCYHVVWFATNGYTTDENGVKYYNALADSAILDGVIIRDGYAYNRDINKVEHNAFGGGAYLVGNATVRNCEVFHCEASRGGGGLYLDHGGVVENCFVHDCQTLGVNSTSGFGGGIAVDQKGLVTHCALINNVGRSGGGMSLNYDPEEDTDLSEQYHLAVRASLIAQNVATVEAGGIYMERGGLMNGVTLVKNQTYGTGVTLNGIVTGRSGGVYVRDHARIYNSVLWGNQTSANNLQYATSRSSADESLKPSLSYVALSRADYTDWSGTKKIGISKLADENQGTSSSSVKYPLFSKICVAAGHVDDQSGKSINASSSYLKEYLWRPTSSSGLCYAGLQLLDISEAYTVDLSAGFIVKDLKGLTFSPKCALGAYTAEIETPQHAVVHGIKTIFVDPNRASGANYATPGISWDCPMDNLTDALTYFSNLGEGGQIFVKEGTLYTAARSDQGRMRGTTIQMVSGVNVKGGYSAELTGTNLSLRNPIAYPTIITGKVSENDYQSNVAHLVTFDNVSEATLDGFQLRLGNAASVSIDDYGRNGAGVLVKNNASATLLNTSISDCSAKSGAAVYVESGNVSAENCIFRNCQSSLTPLYDGIVYVGKEASMTLNHCDIVRNVGYSVANNGTFTSYNSLYYSNMKQEVEDTNGKGSLALPAFTGSGTFAGDHNLFDQASVSDYAHIPAMGLATLDWTFSTSSTTYPRFVNSTKNAGVSVAGDVTYYGLAVDYTPSDMNPVVNAASTNGVAHNGISSSDVWGTDMTTLANRDFGGLPDVGALENGAFKANSATQPKYGTTFYVRDYRNADGSIDYTSGGNGFSWSGAVNGNAWYNETTGENMKLAPVDYTYKIKNARFYATDGWNGTTPTDYKESLATIEFYNKTYDYYQDINNLPNGWYYLSCQAFYRNGEYNSSADVHAMLYGVSNGTEYKCATRGIADEESENRRLDIQSIQEGFTANPWPNQLYSASYCFNYGLYNTGLWVRVTNGSLRVGIMKEKAVTNDWTACTNFQLKYYGNTTNHPTAVGVNGLQLAVDMAHRTMSPYFEQYDITSVEKDGVNPTTTRHFYTFTPTDEHPQVDVWVGAGVYTNPDGFRIRNRVHTYGGFPKKGNPGMNERHPQLTTGVPLSLANQGLTVADYETILQTNQSLEERNLFKKSVSVLSHPFESRVTVYDDYNKHHTRTVYEDVEWDGFTIRYGCKEGVVAHNGRKGRRNGGAGVSIYENVTIRNCIIRDNYTGDGKIGSGRNFRASIGRGGGVYCDGGILENCYIMDNTSDCSSNGGENYGGGLYMIRGTMFNTVVTGNRITYGKAYTKSIGNGVFFESAKFYNNTIVNNTGGISAIGVWTASAEDASLTVYNSIVMDENVPILKLEGASTPAKFDHCFLQTTSTIEYKSDTEGTYTKTGYTNTICHEGKSGSQVNPFALSFAEAVRNYDYRINFHSDNTNCVNAGTENLGSETYYNKRDNAGVPQAKLTLPVTLPDHDMDWAARIQDCRVDIGAYEYNGADEISPDTDPTRVEEGTAVFYVTEKGYGTTQAFDPANAACAEKLQKVLDAAGRYKYDHVGTRVIVKLAGIDATADSYNEETCFKYFPCRTTDEESDNVRVWSIMVPRGVEVWGGYTVDDVLDKTTNADIAPYFSEDERSVMYHPTFLQTQYNNSKLNEDIKGYHVVTFTDKTFDENGLEREGKTLSSKGVTDRAVLDGLFLTGGQADGESTGSTSANMNSNQFGGAAIVTNYAHVRNCIIKNNEATYGGALALMNKGLVSGCLIIDNEANYGGGIYVFEDGISLSTGETNHTQEGTGALDENMPHVYTTTIVKNTGKQQGGGLWFSNDAEKPNVRVNSTVLWQNDSPDQANVAGQTSPDMPGNSDYSTLEWYPFAYSAVQNIRVSGTSNISVDIQNRNGNRFGVDSRTDSTIYTGKDIARDTTEVDYYGLTIFSALCRTGMPYATYASLVENEGLSARDYNKWSRDTVPQDANERSYIDIGARAYPSSPVADLKHPFLRLFVAQTQDVNMDAYLAMQDYSLTAQDSDPNYIYGLLGSSFAYPFHNLDDALEYIGELRKSSMWTGRANNMPFEICIARGDYFPQRDMQGNYGYSLANTYLIPEGVTLMGGFDCNDLYGQYLRPDYDKPASEYTNVLSNNVGRFGSEDINMVGKESAKVEIIQRPLEVIAEDRALEDLNMNNIKEPWEFMNQTNLSGNTVNLQNSGVYHVVSVIPYAPGVGQLPLASYTNPDYEAHGAKNGYGFESKEIGQPVIIDGVHISDGYARDYVKSSLTDIGIYDYYRGGGLQGTGNWYCSKIDGSDDNLMHSDVPNAVAYRDIPLYVRNSQFINNQAGCGAAMDVNISTHIYNCIFAQNKALTKEETVDWIVPTALSLRDSGTRNSDSKISYPGTGGAISFANALEVYNTIFSNNEAEDSKSLSRKTVTMQKYPNLQNPDPAYLSYGGAGGAIFGGEYCHLKVLNCDFVNNKASLYPAIYTLHPNQGISYDSDVTEADYNLVANSVFWGNAVPSTVSASNTFAQKLCINYGKKSGTGSYDYDLSQAPSSQSDLDQNYSEALWFSGYEKGCASSAANSNDYREITYSTDKYIGKTIYEHWRANYSDIATTYEIQNANIALSSYNDDLEGPNFCNPSTAAGYDGYNEAADWSRSRLNNLTDNGSCFLNQDVVNDGKDGYIVNWKNDVEGRLEGDGAYYQTYYLNEENNRSMDLGSSLYMQSVATDVNLPRVAPDPCPTHDKAYIDLGVYEYPHSKLIPSTLGDAVDILWVSTIERPENGTPDGKSWETPTSDLQRAIETLMASRNGHRKEIRVMDGEYTPVYTYNGYKTFYLNTQDLNNQVYFDEDAYEGNKLKYNQEDIDNYYVRSLTIKGGYSKDLRDQYDTELYPVTFRQSERLDGTSETWNYLFLIDDATQRYGTGSATMDGYGARGRSDRYVSAIPVQIDGVHLVNNQALPGTHGAAIRYDDQVNTYIHEGKTYTNYVNAPTSANVSITKEEYDALSKDSQYRNDVHCTYWEDDTYTIETQDNKSPYVLYYRTIESPAKLILSKCCIMNSGTHYDVSTREDYSSSAVYVGQYGGDALIYNSVFHSNWGNPLEAYNTRTINNTVALNYGRWILKNQGNLDNFYESGSGEGNGEMLAPGLRKVVSAAPDELVSKMTSVPRASKIMNTVLWRNNPSSTNGATTYGQQFSLDGYVSDQDVTSKDIFRRNAYVRYDENGELMVTEGTDYDDEAFTSNYWNTYLSLANDNISHGPNFKNPILNASDASQGGDIEQRDFSLQPSVRLVDKGDETIYAGEVFDMAWIPTTELDYLDQNRVIALNIEVGAIEYPHPLLRVIYVDPTQKENKSGMSWSSTMNAENLQNAIDMAAIYSATNKPLVNAYGEVVDRNEAYVFVKGNNDTKFPEVILRNGVNIYGSIDANVNNDSVRYAIDERTGQYIYPHLQEDVEQIVKTRPGLVGAGTERTVVPSISTGENNTFDADRPTRIDGFVVSAKSEENVSGAILAPVLDIDPTTSDKNLIPAVALVNVVVSDNDATSQGINVANVNNALIYEVLFRDNAVDKDNYVLNFGSTGYGVNLTVEGKTNDAAGKCEYPTTDDQAISQSSHIWYSIYNYMSKPVDEFTLSGHNYPVQMKDLNYQLAEHSKNMDRCPATNPMTLQSETANLVEFINYEKDLDLLSNPRVLDVRTPGAAKKLDRGAFETWCIGDDTNGQTVYTNVNPEVYYGNYYPHEGSVVYLLKNSNLISEAHSLVPGYLLVKQGASLFAHGQTVKAAYVAVERDIKAEGNIVAVPYAMDYNHWTTTDFGPATYSYDGNGVLTLSSDAAVQSYTYNGEMRASARYQLQNSNSKCWNLRAQDADPVPACQGVFFTSGQDGVYRFTGKGVTMKNYIYTEQPKTDAEGNLVTTAKMVTLYQNNHQPTDGNGELTAAEDMGWNCFGIPYLVSEYKPYEKAYDNVYNHTASTQEYMMQLPKNLWLYYDAAVVDELSLNNWTSKDAKNYAGFYVVESWKGAAADWHLSTTPSLWVGEGMFAQTASYTDEELYFYLPVYNAGGGAAPARRLTRVYVGQPIEEELDKSEALENTIYDLQGHKIQTPTQHGVYIVNGKRVWM